MAPEPDPTERAKPEDDAQRLTGSLAALAVVLALLVIGLLITQTLRRSAAVEDCLMAGRINCNRVATSR